MPSPPEAPLSTAPTTNSASDSISRNERTSTSRRLIGPPSSWLMAICCYMLYRPAYEAAGAGSLAAVDQRVFALEGAQPRRKVVYGDAAGRLARRLVSYPVDRHRQAVAPQPVELLRQRGRQVAGDQRDAGAEGQPPPFARQQLLGGTIVKGVTMASASSRRVSWP